MLMGAQHDCRRTGACSLAQSEASTGCCTPIARRSPRCRARAQPQERRPVPRLRAAGPNQVWSWDITYLPATVRGVWLYLYLVIDVWSRRVVVWDVAVREDSAIAADLVSTACLRGRISKSRQQPLILHLATTTRTRNHFSAQQNTGPITQGAH